MKKRIALAVKALGLVDQKVFTIEELEAIAARANAPMFEVMWYLRYER